MLSYIDKMIQERLPKPSDSDPKEKETRTESAAKQTVVQMLEKRKEPGTGPGEEITKLKVIQWNARCSIHENKKDALLAHNADIYLLQEVQRVLVPPPDFTQCKDRRAAIWYRKSVTFDNVIWHEGSEDSEIEAVGVTLCRKNHSMTFYSVYRPPTATCAFPTLSLPLHSEALVVGGDFNLHHEAWSANIPPSTCQNKALALYEWSQNNDLCALNDGTPTWKKMYTPDITWYRGEYIAETWRLIHSDLSDHAIIEIQLNLMPIESTHKLTKNVRGDLSHFATAVEEVLQQRDVPNHKCLKVLFDAIEKCQRYIPQGHGGRIIKSDHTRKVEKTISEYAEEASKRVSYMTKKKIRHSIPASKRLASNLIQHFLRFNPRNKRKLRRLPKIPVDFPRLYISKTELEQVLKVLKRGKAPGIDNVQAELLISLKDTGRIFLRRVIQHALNSGDASPFTTGIIVPIPKNRNTTSTDQYRPITLLRVISKIIEKIILRRIGQINIHPNQHAYRRGNSIIDATGPLVDLIYRAKSHTFPWNFSPKRTLHRPHRVVTLMFDLTSAFDTVDHNLLVDKLQKLNINPLLLRYIRNSLQNRTVQVRVEGIYSQKRKVKVGVPQGGVLGPFLFLVYVNDLILELGRIVDANAKKSQIRMYADDLTISLECEHPYLEKHLLQKLCDCVKFFCERHRLHVNAAKSLVKCFTTSSHTKEDDIDPEVYINGTKIPYQKMGILQHAKSLGTILDSRGNLCAHVKDLVRRASPKTIALSSIWRSYPLQSLKSVAAEIEGILLFQAPIFYHTAGKTYLHELEKAHHRLLRAVTGACSTTPYQSLLLEMDTLPMTCKLQLSSIIHAEKCVRKGVHLHSEYGPSHQSLQLLQQTLVKLGLPLNFEREPILDFPLDAADPDIYTIKNVKFQYLPIKKNDPSATKYCQQAVCNEKKRSTYLVSTDGSPENNTAAAIIYKYKKMKDGSHKFKGIMEITQPVQIDASPSQDTFMVCSMTTEMYAIYIGLSSLHLILPTLKPGDTKCVLLMTDSQSSMMALEHGALQNENQLAYRIWLIIGSILEKGYKLKIMHVFSHIGIKENEAADALASRPPREPSRVTFAEAHVEKLPPPPISLADFKSNVKKVLKREWITSIDTNTQRYKLVGATPTPKDDICPITLKQMSLVQLSHLRRIRCGHSEIFGRVCWAIYNLPPVCRFCYNTRKPHNLESNEDPYIEPEPRPPDKRKAVVKCFLGKEKKIKKRPKVNRTPAPCKICRKPKKTFSCFGALKTHYQRYHPDEDPPVGLLKCRYCEKTWPSTLSRRTHEFHCKPKIPKNNTISVAPDLRTQETIAHIEECPMAPKLHHLMLLKLKYGDKWYFSLPFLQWVLLIFGEHELIDELKLTNLQEEDSQKQIDQDSDLSDASSYTIPDDYLTGSPF